MAASETDLLKIAALEPDDLPVLSAHVQDAVFKVGDVLWQPHETRVIIPVNRFAWERASGRRKTDERRRSVLQIDQATRFRASGVSPQDRETVLSVLAVLFEETDAPAGTMTVVCSGEVLLRMEVECVETRLTDLGAAWAAAARPRHV